MTTANFVVEWPTDFDPDDPKVLAEGAFISKWIDQDFSDWNLPLHVHPTGQLVHTLHGTSFLELRGRSVPVCTGCAMWVPAGIPHCIRIIQGSSLLCFHPGTSFLDLLPPEPELMILNSVALELVRFFCLRRQGPHRSDDQWKRIIHTAVVEISLSAKLPSIYVTPTRNAKLVKVIEKLRDDESCAWKNKQWAEYLNMSEKSLGRLSFRETGLSFRKFRQHYSMIRSLQLLSEDSVESVSQRVGYESLSSYIVAFKNHFGTTPGAFKNKLETQTSS